jgi:hypothetical protein
MSQHHLAVFAELIRTPFQNLGLVWGVVPLYFALLLSELTSAKKSFRTALQTGFSFLWAGAQWLYLYRNAAAPTASIVALKGLQPISLVVTGIVLVLGGGGSVQRPASALPQVCFVSWPYPVQQLFHDHHLPNSGTRAGVDLESIGCNRHLCGAGLVGSTLWVNALSREEMSGQPSLELSPLDGFMAVGGRGEHVGRFQVEFLGHLERVVELSHIRVTAI